MSQKVKIEKKGEFDFSKELIHGSKVLLKHSVEGKVYGSFYSRMSSLILAAFSVEAFLNHVGNIIDEEWEGFDKKRIKDKLARINEILEIDTDFGKAPLQNIDELFKYRNMLAHGRLYENVKETLILNEDEVSIQDRYSRPEPELLKKMDSDKSVQKVIDNVELYTRKVESRLEREQLVKLYDVSYSGSITENYSKK